MKLRPLLNRILVKPLELDEASAGGIFLPQAARDEMMQQGLVVEVGEGLPTTDGDKVVACKVKKGDKVLFQKYAGSEGNSRGGNVSFDTGRKHFSGDGVEMAKFSSQCPKCGKDLYSQFKDSIFGIICLNCGLWKPFHRLSDLDIFCKKGKTGAIQTSR